MRYILSDPDTTILTLIDHINSALRSGSVLLLFSGGSNIPLEVQIANQLQPVNKLTIGLIDERYGPEGDQDSNWTQLLQAGFKPNSAELLPVLNGDTVDQTTADYNQKLTNAFQNHDTVIGIFGIGIDGHTSGVLPRSPSVHAEALVTHYTGPDFERITTTPLSFGLFDQAYLVAYGESKFQPLDDLSLELSIDEQPAQALKMAKQLIIFNDQIGPAGADL